MNALRSFWTWLKNKCGRVFAGTGFIWSGLETFNIDPIKQPIEELFPKYGHQIVLGTISVLFLASWLRHQYVASKVGK